MGGIGHFWESVGLVLAGTGSWVLNLFTEFCLLNFVFCRSLQPNALYNFETWGDQILDFIEEKVGQPAFLICNSVGGEALRSCKGAGNYKLDCPRSR